MKSTHAFSVLALFAAAIPAQNHDPSPRGLLTVEGKGSASYFGNYSSARHMFLDGELRGKPGIITEVAYREDYRTHTIAEMGRFWNRVTLHVAECDVNKASSTFRNNPTTTPARAFSGAIAWPSLRNLPHSRPAPWAGINGGMAFPFVQPWVYNGTSDVLLDYDLAGGVLANNGTWSTLYRRDYYLDGFGVLANTTHGTETRFGKSLTTGGCVGKGAFNGWGGHAQLGTITVGPKTVTNPNTYSLNLVTLATEKDKPVIHAITLGGSATGIPFPGVTCNRLHVDLSKPHVLLTKTATTNIAQSVYTLGPFPYSAAVTGIPIWFQGAWTDTGTGALMLTNASSNFIAAVSTARLRTCVWTEIPANKGSSGRGPFEDPVYNPVCRYTR